jgi:hypothetical protein
LLVLREAMAAKSPETVDRFAIGFDGFCELFCNPVTLATMHAALPEERDWS